MKIHNALLSEFPSGLEIDGHPYPPGAVNQLLSTLMWYTFVVGIVSMFAGRAIYGAVGFAPGLKLVDWMEANHAAVLVGLLALNHFSNSLVATGAFEVHLDGRLVHSKLESGHMPSLDLIAGHVRRALQARDRSR